MELPSDEIGISDIIAYRNCPAEFAFGMQRHTETEEHPQRESYASAYGHCVHDLLEYAEQTQCSDDDAIAAVFPNFSHWLEPDDIQRMKDDLETWRTRQQTGWRLVGTELELKMPLFRVDGRAISFRARIDALYQRIDNPSVFMTRDYKSSRWPKTEAEVHADQQQWAYNCVVHYNYPECASLIQVYDQLRYGEIPTQKSQAQRSQMFQWLKLQVKAILADDELKPKANDWCQYCPLMMDCPVTHRSTEWWVSRLAALAPERKDGRKLVTELAVEVNGIETYAEILPAAKKAKGVLERFVAEVERTLKAMPQERRELLGFELGKPKKLDVFTADALRKAHAMVGDDLYHLVKITKGALEEFYGKEDPRTLSIIDLASKKQTAPSVKAKR